MHPIDRLGEIRGQLRELLKERRQIRSLLLSGDISARGERYTASVVPRVTLKAIEPSKVMQFEPVPPRWTEPMPPRWSGND